MISVLYRPVYSSGVEFLIYPIPKEQVTLEKMRKFLNVYCGREAHISVGFLNYAIQTSYLNSVQSSK
jgi:hypothetical protein